MMFIYLLSREGVSHTERQAIFILQQPPRKRYPVVNNYKMVNGLYPGQEGLT